MITFLVLAAQFESYVHPFVIMLTVPLAIFGGMLGLYVTGSSLNLYSQIGLLMLIGLAAKNGILIVEFARELEQRGMATYQAAITASRMRLRPILMTSLAFGLGVVPLAISTGAGSGSQNAIGTGVLGGTISATVLGIFFVPLFFVVVTQMFSKKRAEKKSAASGE